MEVVLAGAPEQRSLWLGKAVELFPEGSAECVSFLSGAFDGGERLLEEVGS